jgi:glycerophosphoryl diester phosphodiesterase
VPRLQAVVSSFDPAFDPAPLEQARHGAPGAAVGLLLAPGQDWRDRLAGTQGFRAVHPAEADAQPELFSEALARGLAVVPWTVDDPGRALQLAALGAAGLITNRPRAVLGALGRGPSQPTKRHPQ